MRPSAVPSAACLVLVLSAAGFAAPARALDCANAVNTIEMTACAEQELNAEDARLNAVFKRLSGKVDGDARALLRDAQRAWIEYRDRRCDWEADAWRGGTGASLLHLGCMTGMTKQRADELTADLENR